MLKTASPHGGLSQIANDSAEEPEMLSGDAYLAYSYLLGLYLGDGDITSHTRGVFGCA
jgi:hypothetical protein